jgi:hypothetical protein
LRSKASVRRGVAAALDPVDGASGKAGETVTSPL